MGGTQSAQPQITEKITFVGGRDDRKVDPSKQTGKDIEGDQIIVANIPMSEGTWSSYSLTINPDGTWVSEEQGGYQFAHDRAVNRIASSGTWKVNDWSAKYEFTVDKFESVNSDRRASPPKNGEGKVFSRSVADINGTAIIKSFFFDGEMKKQ